MRYRYLVSLFVLFCLPAMSQRGNTLYAVLTNPPTEQLPGADGSRKSLYKSSKTNRTDPRRHFRIKKESVKQFLHRNRRILGLSFSLLLVVGAFVPGLNLVVGGLRLLKLGIVWFRRTKRELKALTRTRSERKGKNLFLILGLLTLVVAGIVALTETGSCSGYFCISTSGTLVFLAFVFLLTSLLNWLAREIGPPKVRDRIVELPSHRQLLKNRRVGAVVSMVLFLLILVPAVSDIEAFGEPIKLVLIGISTLFTVLFGMRLLRIFRERIRNASSAPRFRRPGGGPVYRSREEVPPLVDKRVPEEPPRPAPRKEKPNPPKPRKKPNRKRADHEMSDPQLRSRSGQLSVVVIVLGLLALIFMFR